MAILDRKREICNLESAICALYDCVNPILYVFFFIKPISSCSMHYQQFVCERKTSIEGDTVLEDLRSFRTGENA